MDEHSKPFIEHLEDLRLTLIKCGVTLIVAMAGSLCFAQRIYDFLYWPLHAANLKEMPKLQNLDITTPFTLDMEVGISTGLIIAMPLLLFFIGQFVLPALTPRERKMLTPVFTAGAFLFLVGVAFAFFIILPKTLNFFFEYSINRGWQAQWTIQAYIDFVVQITLAFGVGFELPIVILALGKLGIVNAAMLSKFRKHAVLVIAILAAIITPTPDLLTMSFMFVPMYILFEISIVVCRWVENPPEEREELKADEYYPH
jgi:sec-independent protein translocase protein TatC